MSSTLLRDRAIVCVSGIDAEALLNRLLTRNMLGMAEREARYAALLSPQGKLLFDFLVYRNGQEFWIDCRPDQRDDLVRKLTMFKLRAAVSIAAVDDLAVAMRWDDEARPETAGSVFRDPRHPGLGWRIVAPSDGLAEFADDPVSYRSHCIALGVPTGGVDWRYGDTFVHDANLDLLHGVDFDKGCYVGQEVVSRVHHRNSARKRVVRIRFLGDPPPVGTALTAGPLQVGQITSIDDHRGLGTVRLDRLGDVAASGTPVTADGTLVELALPDGAVLHDHAARPA